MKKKLCLCLLGIFSSFVYAQELDQKYSYQITISDIKGTSLQSINTTVNPQNIIESDFSHITALKFDCIKEGKQTTESVQGIFSSTYESQDLTLEITNVLNKKELEKKGCDNIAPDIDSFNITIGFPFLIYQKIITTAKSKYIIEAKKI